MTEKDADPAQSSGRMPFPAPLVAIVVFAAALAFLYVTRSFHHNEAQAATQPQSCPLSTALLPKLKPLVHGQVAALALADAPKPMPALTFADGNGKMVKLSDFRGRSLLLNLWAAWCVPCRKEMPTLDRLEAKEGGPGFQVVTINVDTQGTEKPKAFFKQIGVKSLTFYADTKADVFPTLKQDGKVIGLPTTILVGKDGCALGTMAGPAEWDSKEALALIEAEKG
jgi:thiol-disulfide isomerase/thioredoxin